MPYFAIIITICLALSPVLAAVDELSTARKGANAPEIAERTYDLEGQKAEWILGTSILGNPDLNFRSAGMASPTRRLPSKLAGIFTFPLEYDATQLSMYGENGIMKENFARGIPVDTPETHILWERYSFNGNAFGLDFRRLLLDSIEQDIGMASYSNDSSKVFRYQDVTHQPFFALGRDSSQIPFSGRNVQMNTTHFKPAIAWYLPKGTVVASMNYLVVQNDDVPPYSYTQDTTDYSKVTYLKNPLNTELRSFTYGIRGSLKPIKPLEIYASIYSGEHEINYDSLPDLVKSVRESIDEDGEVYKDTTWYGVTDAVTYETVNGDGGIAFKMPFNPALRMEYEFTEVNSRYKQDRELYYLELQDKLSLLDFRIQAGALRNSNIFDSVEVARMASAYATFHLPYHVDLQGTFREDVRFPDIDELKLYNRARYAYPNAELKEEERVRMTGDIKWNPGGIFYGVGLRYEYVDNPIKQRWVTGEGLESIERASQWINLDYAEALDWYVAAGFSIGNWQFYLEREQSLAKQHRPIDVTNLYYKGYIRWADRFVNNRLGVSVAFDFTWFGNRYDLQITENEDKEEVLEIVELKHYLALNFEARMRILSFSLYTRIDNLNHSLYEPAAGYRPEGVRFLYGITWSFDN
ncbi:MAG: hypothetical protein J6Z31_06970 [Fibrobacter sp.]|nr:hypothetical protein [Fibrobacter sp.]